MGNFIKSTLTVSGLAVLSRVFGMIRDVIIAMVFGASGASDAFFLAFRFPDLLRKLFSEGILSISFIPAFTGVLNREGRSGAASMAVSALLMVSVWVTIISMAGLFISPVVSRLIAHGELDSYASGLTVVLFKWMMPYMLVISLLAVCMGILNTLGNFVVPAAGPVVFNLVVIFFALIISPLMERPIIGIAIGVTAGGVIQLGCQIPFLAAHGMLSIKRVQLLHPKVLVVFKRMIPAMIGAAGYQINIFIGTFLAFSLAPGNVSFLYYADRLVQFAAGILTMSVATVILPRLSQKAHEYKQLEMYHEFFSGIRLVFFLILPAMAGLIALRYPVVELLFHRGAFDERAVQDTAQCLLFLSLGLWAVSGTRLMVTLYHSLSNTRLPFYAGILSILVNGAGSIWLVPAWGLPGIALSISGAAVVNFFVLAGGMRLPSSDYKRSTGVLLLKTALISGMMFICVSWVSVLIFSKDYGKLTLFSGVLGCILLGVLVYLGLHVVIGGPEVNFIKEIMKKKTK